MLKIAYPAGAISLGTILFKELLRGACANFLKTTIGPRHSKIAMQSALAHEGTVSQYRERERRYSRRALASEQSRNKRAPIPE